MMKWTMFSVAMMGLATYGLILVAQLRHGAEPETAPVVATVVEEDLATPVATPEPSTVSQESSATEAAPPTWTGDPWQAGVRAFEAGENLLAVEALQVAVAEREDSSYRHYVLGLALRRIGETERAVVELERSLELSPAATKSWIALARCELDRQDPVAARAAVDAALELDLDSADAWHLLGRVEFEEGSFEQAEAAFAKALDRDPQHAWAANNLGYVRILQERFTEALAPLQAAVAGGEAEPVFFNNLGTALERTGNAELAALAFAHAAVLGHEPAESSMARVEERLGGDGVNFAAADSLETVGAGEFAARVEEAVLIMSAEVVEELPVDEEVIVVGELDGHDD